MGQLIHGRAEAAPVHQNLLKSSVRAWSLRRDLRSAQTTKWLEPQWMCLQRHSTTEFSMTNVLLNLPTFGFIVSTRAALGVGIGLLVSERLPVHRRRAIGATLVAIGAATTVPAARSVIRSMRRSKQRDVSSAVHRDKRLIGASRFPRKGDDIG
jgi:hypothetical protein